MKKNILFIVIGFVAGAIVVALLEFLLEFIFPHPEVDFNNREALTKMMSEMPVIAYILLALTHFLAIFVGGFVTGMRSESYPVRNALIVGGIFMVFTILPSS